ncbi:MAG TPA: iron dependent repressor, metal binding and dimerization domain protein [Phycisphaerales bacterium]|nr:iron dependent repressor, metal binding and dimerization domain protein [Phycisphaerales bacterium]
MPNPGRQPADRFTRTRAAHRDETAEDYAEAVAQLTESVGHARVGELARMMGVSHVTVSRIVTRLRDLGLLDTGARCKGGGRITLTPAGKRLAARSRQRHDTVLRFLLSLGVPAHHAEIDAEGIEHHVSAATIRAMERVLRRSS